MNFLKIFSKFFKENMFLFLCKFSKKSAYFGGKQIKMKEDTKNIIFIFCVQMNYLSVSFELKYKV